MQRIEELKQGVGGEAGKCRAFTLKVLNQSVQKSMMNAESGPPTLAIDDEIELLDLQPVSVTGGF